MRFEDIVAGLPETKLTYWEDPYRKEDKSNLIAAAKEGGNYYVVLDSTIFHPKSGGQPSDTGTLTNENFTFNVRKVFRVGKHVVLFGKAQGELKLDEVIQRIDWEKRYLYMRRHAAAHLFDAALDHVRGIACDPVDSWLGDDPYVGYRGKAITQNETKAIMEFIDDCIRKDMKVSSSVVDRSEVKEDRSLWRNVLESLERVRIVQIDNFKPIPCGGTHVERLREINRVILKEVRQDADVFRIYYDVIG
ncbi:MAG: alanyl-tRNA editing protein [Conexivisphaerales archaeon]